MKKLNTLIVSIVIFAILHAATVLVLTNAKIFPCKISSIGSNMQMSEWKDGMCDVNYRKWIGSVQVLNTGSSFARIGLIYVLPLLLTIVIMYGLHKIKNKPRLSIK